MFKKTPWRVAAALVVAALFLPGAAFAAPPVVKVVPWNPGNVLVPHDTYSGKSITLKGTTDVVGAPWVYDWDFGDGSAVDADNPVVYNDALEARHTYTDVDGKIFTATLTVRNPNTGESASKNYYVKIQPKTLDVEVNVAIDEGLWYIHKTMTRYACTGGLPCGHWRSARWAGTTNYNVTAVTAANVNALLVNGHREDGSADNPYVETVQRGVRDLFTRVHAVAVDTAFAVPGFASVSADANNADLAGVGKGVRVSETNEFYQGGPVMDAIVATGTPDRIVDVGSAGVVGRKYKDVVGDMVDYYLHCAYRPAGGAAGGWRYSCQSFPDNSAAQWGAIGLLAAHGYGGVVVPDWIKVVNRDNWLNYSLCKSGFYLGTFGYTGACSFAWGQWATTPSGMVQLAMDGVGRNNCNTPLNPWDLSETYMRNYFGNVGGATSAVKGYYYGLFALTKAMLLHDPDAVGAAGHGTANPIQKLRSCSAGVTDIDWYAAETTKGDPTDGVARTLVNAQTSYAPGGAYWYGHNYSGEQYYFETAWAIMMLNRQLFAAGSPVAVAKATPNPGVANQVITLDGSGSFHQDPTKFITKWEWDTDNDGVFDKLGVTTTVQFSAVGDYNVKLRVTDNAGASAQTADTILVVQIKTPPIAPTAKAGGPYNFCLSGPTMFLNGLGSINPDDGKSEPHVPPYPGDFIKSYGWDLDGGGVFTDATGATPDVTAWFTAKGAGSYLIQLKVTDNTAASFPSSGLGDLSDTDSGQVFVRTANDPACTCVTLTAQGKARLVNLTWTASAGAHHYNVYRSTVNGGPYAFVASVLAPQLFYANSGLTPGTYYYVVRPALINNTETCQSNQAAATALSR